MDLQGAKAHNSPRWAWARTGAIILFVLTGILLLASLSQAKSLHGAVGAAQAIPASTSSLPLQRT